jgi:F0F1-type ATP synthase membrane subunit b/b'
MILGATDPAVIQVSIGSVSLWLFVVLLILGYFLIRDAVKMGIISAWRWRERQAAKDLERAAKEEAQLQASRAKAAASPASPGSAPPAVAGSRRTAS